MTTNCFGINTQGTNQDAHSVASQVGRRYDSTFLSIPRQSLAIGDIHSGDGVIKGLKSHFHGIVCNEKKLSGKQDWTYADLGVSEGLSKLASGIIVPKEVATERLSLFRKQVGEILGAGVTDTDLYRIIDEYVLSVDAVLNPPIRMAFIGTGPDGTKNRADWKGILEQMNNSSLNIILYLWDQEIQTQVAAVVRQFPTLRASVALDEIERIYGIAA